MQLDHDKCDEREQWKHCDERQQTFRREVPHDPRPEQVELLLHGERPQRAIFTGSCADQSRHVGDEEERCENEVPGDDIGDFKNYEQQKICRQDSQRPSPVETRIEVALRCAIQDDAGDQEAG